MIKAILFDFDGVILDSLEVKTKAFYEMYLPYGKDIAEKAAQHHLWHGGVSRFEKFKIYHQEFLSQYIDENKVSELCSEYSLRVKKEVINAPKVPGVLEFLEKNHQRFKYWIITGTPTSEIKDIIQAINLSHYFVDCFGSPEKKTYWTKKILQENNFEPDEVVFIGDAFADIEAAEIHGTHFILREHKDNQFILKEKKLKSIKDFTEVERILSTF
jgi:phosphoglycolate phosphatase-like HAD superfamily hydrolase